MSGAKEGNKRAYVWNIPYGVSENELAKKVKEFGLVRHVYFPKRKPSEKYIGDANKNSYLFNCGYGYIEFASSDATEKFIKAAEDNKIQMGNEGHIRSLRASVAKQKASRKRRIHKQTNADELKPGKAPKEASSHEWVPMDLNPPPAPPKDGSNILEKISPELWDVFATFLSLPTMLQLRRVSKTLLKSLNNHIANRLQLDLRIHPKGEIDLKCSTFKPNFVDTTLIQNIFGSPNDWHSLRVLHLQGKNVRLTPFGLSAIGKNVRSLEEVSLSCYHTTNKHFRTFVMSNHSLRRFSFHVHSGTFSLLSLRCLFKNCLLLTHFSLDVSKCTFDFNGIDVTNSKEKSKEIFSKRPELKFLSIKSNEETAEKLEPLLVDTFSPFLIVLSLSAMPVVEIPNLRQIFISQFPINKSDNFWSNFPKLESLVYNCPTPASQNEISTKIFSLPNSHVSDLALRNCKIDVLESLVNLSSLDLTDSCDLREDSLKFLLKKNNSLSRLSLAGCCKTSAETLRFIGENCKNLTVLNISDCPEIDYEAILGFANAHSQGRSPPPPVTVLAFLCKKVTIDGPGLNMLESHGVTLRADWNVVVHWLPIVPLVDSTLRSELLLDTNKTHSCSEHGRGQIFLDQIDMLNWILDDLGVNEDDFDGDDEDFDDGEDDEFDPDFDIDDHEEFQEF